MEMRPSVERAFHRTFDWSGRASRSEYWWFALFSAIAFAVFLVLAMTVATTFSLVVWIVFSTATGLGVTVRRLHDTDRSGWWWLLSLVPYGAFAVLIFNCLPSTLGPNRYGPPSDPAAQAKAHRNLARQLDLSGMDGNIYLAVGYAALATVYAGEAGESVEDDLAWLSLRREAIGDLAFRRRLLEVLDERGTEELLQLTSGPHLPSTSHPASDPMEKEPEI